MPLFLARCFIANAKKSLYAFNFPPNAAFKYPILRNVAISPLCVPSYLKYGGLPMTISKPCFEGLQWKTNLTLQQICTYLGKELCMSEKNTIFAV